WPRPPGDYPRAGLELERIASRRGENEATGSVDATAPTDHVHLVLAQQELHALVQLADHLVATAPGDRVIEVDIAGRDPERVRMTQLVEQRRTLQQCLGRDAAAMQTRAADL